MNWIIILLLFGCGGCGNSCCGSDRSCQRGRGREACGCRERTGRDRDNGCGCEGREGRGNDCGCREEREDRSNDCGCARETAREAVRDAKEAMRDAKEAVRDAREAVRDAREQCDSPGMVPPPWQDYPPMPRRDGRHEDCGCQD